MKCHKKWDIYKVSKYLPTRYILTTKKKKSNFIMDKLDNHHLNEVIQGNSTDKGANGNYVTPDRMQ